MPDVLFAPRRARPFVALLILGNIATGMALSGHNNKSGQNLDCTNNMDKLMSCQFQAQNCTEYKVTLQSNNGHGTVHCISKLCDTGWCCCSVQMILVLGEDHTVTVQKEGEIMESKIISIMESIKPKTPKITSVKESNGNFEVMWTTNMSGYFNSTLSANVTYHKKGGTEKVSKFFKPTSVDGLNYYEILGRHLEPSTTYVVSIQSYTDWSNRFSDSSEEKEFTTPYSFNVLPIIIGLSIAAVLISGALYACFIKFKKMWWDISKCQHPKSFEHVQPSKQQVLNHVPTILSQICVEPIVPADSKPWSNGSLKDTSSGSLQQSSGISIGSSVSYANTQPADIIAGVQDALDKAFANISPISPFTTNLNKDSGLFLAPYNPCCVRADNSNCSPGFTDFEKKSYSFLIPSCPYENLRNSADIQVQAQLLCDSSCHPSEGDIVICPDQQVPGVVSSHLPTDMSHEQSHADSGRFSSAENSSLSSIPSGTNTNASFDFGFGEVAAICEVNPSYGFAPAGLHSFPPVDDDYKPFQNVVEQPDVWFSEKRSVEKEDHLSKYPEESFTKMPQILFSPVVPGSIDNIQGGQCVSELQRPFLPLISADQCMLIISDSGYQSV